MFDIGWSELVVIGVIALIVIGPKELPTVLRTLGHYMGKVKRMASEFQGQFSDAIREAELHDLQKQAQDLTSSVTDISSFDPMADTREAMEQALETKLETKPAPAAEANPEAKTETAVAAEPAAAAALDAPAPSAPPEPAGNDDFAPAAAPPSKPAGGTA